MLFNGMACYLGCSLTKYKTQVDVSPSDNPLSPMCAKQAWDRAEADLKKFTKRTEVANKKELPEILLDNDQT